MDKEFFRNILDSLEEQLAIIDNQGCITFVNESWLRFCRENGGDPDYPWIGCNYLEVCEASCSRGDTLVIAAIDGIKSVLQGRSPFFTFEYPCNSPDQPRWFILRIAPVKNNHGVAFVLTHQDITLRKLAEQAIEELSLHDPLTGLSNRRHFNNFFANEWRRCQRDKTPLCLMMLDLDHFKHYNDEYGHLAGDECLKIIAKLIHPYATRASDLCIRFGGDEFSLILGDSTIEHGVSIAREIITAIAGLRMTLINGEQIGVSIGLTCCVPAQADCPSEAECIASADRALYQAKQNGKNRLEIL